MSIRKRIWNKQTVWIHDHINPATGKRTQPVIRDHLGVPVKSKVAAERIAAVKYAAAVTAAAESPAAVLSDIITVGELLDLHAGRRDISEATRKIESNQAGHLRRILGQHTPAAQISTVTLEDYATTRQAEPTGAHRRKRVSGATVKKEIKLLAQAMRWAHARDMISFAPPRLPEIVTERRQPRCLTREEIAALFDAAGDDNSSLRQILEFAYLTGLRRAELFRLTWTEIDLHQQRITFRTEKRGKSPVKRFSTVYLSDRACELLKRRKTAIPSETAVFAQPPYYHDGKIQASLTTGIRSAACRAGIKNPRQVGMHTMRHSCASHLIEAGATIPAVAAHLRHRDGGALLLRTYAHTHEAALRQAADLLCNKSAT